jgi:thioredoxin 1
MNLFPKMVVCVALMLLASVAFAQEKQTGSPAPPAKKAKPSEQKAGLPRLIDLGANRCIPCKMMAPILEELKKDYAGQFEVEFLDVWVNAAPGRQYGIRLIPTQIFLDPSSKELFRHEGFYARQDILGKWAELGYTFTEPTRPREAPKR